MIAISMRVMEKHYPGGAVEKRDALAQDWHRFIKKALPGRHLLPVPNMGAEAAAMLQSLPVRGLILSGGEDWESNSERDKTEEALFKYACQNNWPILGVCRGAQVINLFAGGSWQSGFGAAHAGKRHEINILPNPFFENTSREVNSFHDNIITPSNLGANLQVLAQAPDQSIEAFFAPKKKIAGILWHPEREREPDRQDITLFEKLFWGGD